jgi:hypothetical protein
MTLRPSCFGLRWDPKAIECIGGLNPAYVHPENQTHRRDRCSWYEACNNQTMNKPITPLLPAASLFQRPIATPQPAQPYTPPRPPTQFTANQPAPTPIPVQASAAPTWSAQPGPPHQQYPTQQYHPAQQYHMPGWQPPPFLSVPEPADPTQHWGRRLGLELLRAVFKAMGWQAASFFDSNPLKRK